MYDAGGCGLTNQPNLGNLFLVQNNKQKQKSRLHPAEMILMNCIMNIKHDKHKLTP